MVGIVVQHGPGGAGHGRRAGCARGLPGPRASVLGALFFGIGLLSDLRSVLAPKGGIGLFFGTFNPFHNTHLDDRAAGAGGAAARQASSSIRRSSRACTPTPSARARSGSAGWRTASRSTRRPTRPTSNVDYFPTGNKFLPPETRKALIELALAEAGLANRVEVAFYPEVYNTQGLPRRDRRDQAPLSRRAAAHACTARISAACWSARSATNAAGSIRGASCAATRFRRRRSARGAKGMTSAVVTDVLAQIVAKSSGGDGWGPPLPERQRSSDRGGLA